MPSTTIFATATRRANVAKYFAQFFFPLFFSVVSSALPIANLEFCSDEDQISLLRLAPFNLPQLTVGKNYLPKSPNIRF